MGMKQTFEIINDMEAAGVIGRYAISGAVAAYNYIEPAVTDDLDILVSFDDRAGSRPGLISLEPVLTYLRGKGYSEFRHGGLVIEDWPVQFLPVSNDLDAEALEKAEDVELALQDGKSITVRILRPEHLVAIGLRTGRPKDLIRVTQFLEHKAVEIGALCDILDRHGLRLAWASFCGRTGISDPCVVSS